jgi:chromosome segregation ATPase
LQSKLHQYREWESLKTELYDVDSFILPAARHFAAAEDLEIAGRNYSAKQGEVAALKADAEEERAEADSKKAALDGLASEHKEVAKREEHLRTRVGETAKLFGRAAERAKQAWREFDASWVAVGRTSLEEVTMAVESAELALSVCLSTRHATEAAIAGLHDDLERIRAGGSMAPPGVRTFLDQLKEAGIDAVVLGDALTGMPSDAAMAAHAQAALGDAIWAVIVPVAHYEQARELAVAADYPWPIASTGHGRLSGVLKFAENDHRFGALLAELDAMPASSSSDATELLGEGTDATTVDGMRHGRVLSRMTPIRDHPLHPAARELAISDVGKKMEDSRNILAESGNAAASLREELASAYLMLDAVYRLQEKRQKFRTACLLLVEARTAYQSAVQDHADVSAEARKLFGRLQGAKVEVGNLENRSAAAEKRLQDAEKELSALSNRRLSAELAIQANPLPPNFTEADAARVEPTSELEVRRRLLEAAVNNRDRFPDDIRDPLIISQCESEENRLREVEQLVADRSGDLDAQEKMVEESQRRYDDHIRALVNRLRDHFSGICEIAGIDGKIELVPGDIQEEWGIDVLVSHKVGETPVSYQEGIHSGGQGTKIAIMLLLAAMSLGRAADLLIVDEHNAHLDGTNTGQIAQLMRRLSSRVQFILSAPTDAKGSAVAGWCDIQVTFLPRDPGHAFSPPVRLMSRLDADSLEGRFESLQQPLALR